MKKIYLCIMIVFICTLSSCTKARIPKIDEVLEPSITWTMVITGEKDVNPDDLPDHRDVYVVDPTRRKTVVLIEKEEVEEPIIEDQTTRVVISSTGREVVLKIPKPTKVLISNANNITVDNQEVANLEKLMNSFDSNVSFCYIDMNTGLTIEARADIKYASASVIKAPVAKSVIESGADLEEEMAIQKSNYLGGSGSLQFEPVGTVYKIKDLIKYTIEESDNVAYDMLCERYGFDQLRANAIKLGFKAGQTDNMIFGYLSSRDAALYFQDIYRYAADGKLNGQLLIDNLKNASYSKLLKSAFPQYEVAEKFGLVNSDILYHTAAIIYSENPYVISIFSNLDEKDAKAAEYIKQIAISLNKIHDSQK